MSSREEIIRAHLRESGEVKNKTAESCVAEIAQAATVIVDAIAGGGRILLLGNGGSAADCQHMAAEFVSRLSADFLVQGFRQLR